MARKINVKLIMELRDAGLSRSTIASTRHISRHSVSEVFNIADEKGKIRAAFLTESGTRGGETKAFGSGGHVAILTNR